MASTRTAAACGLVAVLCGLSAWCDLASATATGYVQSGGALAVTDDFGFIQIFNAVTGAKIGPNINVSAFFDIRNDRILGTAASPDGRYLFNTIVHNTDLRIVVTALGATAPKVLGLLTVKAFFQSQYSFALFKPVSVTKDGTGTGYRVFVTDTVRAPSTVAFCPGTTSRPTYLRVRALRYSLGKGGKLGKLTTGPAAKVPLPTAQQCSSSESYGGQVYQNRVLLATPVPVNGVADKAIGVFEGTLSTTSTGAEKLTFAQTFTGSDSKLSYGLAVAATPTSVFLDASPLPPAAAKGQIYSFKAGRGPYGGGGTAVTQNNRLTYQRIASDDMISFSALYNATSQKYVLQRVNLQQIQEHSQGKVLARINLGNADAEFVDLALVGSSA